MADPDDGRQRAGTGYCAGRLGIPHVASMLVGGWLSDRLRPWRVMLLADAVRLLLMALLAALALGGHPTVAQFCAIAVPLGAFGGAFMPAYMSILPDTLSNEDLQAGNGLMMASLQGANLIGSAFRRKPRKSIDQHPGARCAGEFLALSGHLAADSGNPAAFHRDQPLFRRAGRGCAARAGPRSHAREREQLWHHPGCLGRRRARRVHLRRHAGQTQTQRADHPPGWPDRGRRDCASPRWGRPWSNRLHVDWRRRQQRHQCPALHCGPTEHPEPSDGACHGPADVQRIWNYPKSAERDITSILLRW